MKPTNLTMLFIDMLPNFSHLITKTPMAKRDFLELIMAIPYKKNPKRVMFYLATKKSKFDTIRLNKTKQTILFNQ
jgi:hypothetical protein